MLIGRQELAQQTVRSNFFYMLVKKIVATIFSIFLLFVSYTTVFAAPNINELTADVGQKSGYDVAGTTDLSLSQNVGRIIRIILSMVGTIFFVLTIYAGFLWMTAQGEESKVTKSMGILRTATMGLVLVLAGYGITTFIVGVISTTTGLGGQNAAGYGSGGFWSSFGKSFKDNWWNFVF
jgi:TRAP-type C4-dicarboxylate transport system permease small subunit